jgi:hypothetical protein
VSANTRLECLDLTSSGVGVAIGAEGEGGHILFRPLCQDNQCKISALVLNNAQFNDKAGGKLISALVEGLGKGDHGCEKISLHLPPSPSVSLYIPPYPSISLNLPPSPHRYEKITSISLAKNDLSKQFTTALKQLLWSAHGPAEYT